MPEWTESQKNAFQCRGKDMIVSAGAGSGKTTVLTKRILERIEQGDSVTDFLVVTFTKDSAADLRAKLYAALTALSAEHPGDKRLRTQLYLLPSARISTIHSFCLEIVRANFQLLGLSPKLRIADAEEEKMLASETMEALMDECCEQDDADYELLCDLFAGVKDETALGETMWELYGRLRALDHYFEWLESRENELREEGSKVGNGLFATRIGQKIRSMLVRCFSEAEQAAGEFSDYAAMYCDGSNFETIADELAEYAKKLRLASEESYNAFLRVCEEGSPKFTTLSARKLDAALKEYCSSERKRIKDELTDLVSEYNRGSEKMIAEEYAKTADALRAIRRFLSEFEQMFSDAKCEKGMISFSDCEHFLLKLLEEDGNPTSLCLSLRGQIKEIFVDEYQDVSPLQDRLFRLLSKGSDRFMVGDVKQSIYRFRNAYPDIFLGYKDAFADYAPDSNAPDARIFLRENFRSGKYVVDFVNLLFSRVTAGTPYEREYAGEELVFAKKTEAAPLPVTVALSTYEGLSGDPEREAAYVAAEIRRLVETSCCEGKEGMRPYRYKDIALLFSAIKNKTAVYEKALREAGIPYTVSKEEPFFAQPEIMLALSIFKAIDDPTDDISLFAAMRSPAFGFSAEELYEIRLCSERGPFIRALRAAAEGGDALAEKTKAFLGELEEYRSLAEGKPCHVFVWELYTRTGILRSSSKKGRRLLLKLYEYARKFESGSYKGLSALIAYFKAAEERGAELSVGSDADGDTDHVTLTTIHHSKGLEYAAVFLCESDRRFSCGRNAPYVFLHEDGPFFKLRDPERMTETETFLLRYAKMAERDAEYGEELRKLYVACTRAREKLYIVGSIRSKKLEQGSFHPRACKSHLDLVLCAVTGETSPCFETIVIDDAETQIAPAPEATVLTTAAESFLTPEAEEAIRFVYPFHDALIPAKVSVSELKKQGEDRFVSAYAERQLLVPPSFLQEQKLPDPALRGTANHVFLQFCSFAMTERSGVEAEAERLRQNGFLTEEQFRLLDFDALNVFFGSTLYARMKASVNLRREQRFSVRVPASMLGGSCAETILLQGVIDCFFEEADGTLTVVDYKTDYVTEGETLRKRHASQLEQYREAVRRMTGKPVGKTVLWSFALGKEVNV